MHDMLIYNKGNGRNTFLRLMMLFVMMPFLSFFLIVSNLMEDVEMKIEFELSDCELKLEIKFDSCVQNQTLEVENI